MFSPTPTARKMQFRVTELPEHFKPNDGLSAGWEDCTEMFDGSAGLAMIALDSGKKRLSASGVMFIKSSSRSKTKSHPVYLKIAQTIGRSYTVSRRKSSLQGPPPRRTSIYTTASWIVRIDDNQDCKYSVHNCALIESAFQQRLPDVAIVCTINGNEIPYTIRFTYGSNTSAVQVAPTTYERNVKRDPPFGPTDELMSMDEAKSKQLRPESGRYLFMSLPSLRFGMPGGLASPKRPSWIVRIDDNQDCKYSVHNCALIESAFQQRLPDVAIACTINGNEIPYTIRFTYGSNTSAVQVAPTTNYERNVKRDPPFGPTDESVLVSPLHQKKLEPLLEEDQKSFLLKHLAKMRLVGLHLYRTALGHNYTDKVLANVFWFLLPHVEDMGSGLVIWQHFADTGVWQNCNELDFDMVWGRAIASVGDDDVVAVPPLALHSHSQRLSDEHEFLKTVQNRCLKSGKWSQGLRGSNRLEKIWRHIPATEPLSAELVGFRLLELVEEQAQATMTRHCAFILTSMIQSEEKLKTGLIRLRDVYGEALRDCLEEEEWQKLFGRIDMLLLVIDTWLSDLKQCLDSPSATDKLGQVVLRNAHTLSSARPFLDDSLTHAVFLDTLSTTHQAFGEVMNQDGRSIFDLQNLLGLPCDHYTRKYQLNLDECLKWVTHQKQQTELYVSLWPDRNTLKVRKRLCVQDPANALDFLPVPLVERRIHGKTCVVVSEDNLEPSSLVPDSLRIGDVILALDGHPVNNLDDVAAACAGYGIDEGLTVHFSRYGDRMGEALEAIVLRLIRMNNNMDQAMHRHIEFMFHKVNNCSTPLLKFYHINNATVTLLSENPAFSKQDTVTKRCSQLAVFETHVAVTTVNDKQHKCISPEYIFKLPVDVTCDDDTLALDLQHELQGWVCMSEEDPPKAVPYCPSACRAIEAAYADGDRRFMLIDNDKEYKLDFKESMQISVATGAKRRILRNGLRSVYKASDRLTKDWPNVRMSIQMSSEALQRLREQLVVGGLDAFVHGIPHKNTLDYLRRSQPSTHTLSQLRMKHFRQTDSSERMSHFKRVCDASSKCLGANYELVRDLYCDHATFRAMADRTSVYTLEVANQDQRRQLERVLAFPATRQNMRNAPKPTDVSEALGYAPDLIARAPSPVPFVVGGPVLMPRHKQFTNICVVHATGLNFSKKTTLDYKRYYCTTDAEFEKIVVRKLRELFHLLFFAAADMGCKILRVPAIGLGLFVTACTEPRKLMIEKNFVEQLLLANEKHPGVNLSARFPFHHLLANTCPQLDLFEAVKEDNVCFVNCTDFNHMIGALGTGGIDSIMARQTTSFLHNSVLTPRLLQHHTYKGCPLPEAIPNEVADRSWQRWLIVYHEHKKERKHRHRKTISLSLPSFSKKKLSDYADLQWKIGSDRVKMETKFEGLVCCCKQFYQIRLSGDLLFRLKCCNHAHKGVKDPLKEMMRSHFSDIISKSVRSLCPNPSAVELGLGNWDKVTRSQTTCGHSTSAPL